MKLNPCRTPYTEINIKWIKDLNERAKAIKLLEDSVGEELHDIGFGSDFLDVTPKVPAKRAFSSQPYLYNTPRAQGYLLQIAHPRGKEPRSQSCQSHFK